MPEQPEAAASTNPAAQVHSSAPADDPEYHAFLAGVQSRFATLTAGQPLFAVEISGKELWERFLIATAPEARQRNSCYACRRFIEVYGNLALIAADGTLTSPIWDPALATPELRPAVHRLREAVEKGQVSGVFLSSEAQWGKPHAGGWPHLAVTPDETHVYREGVLTAEQRRSELLEDFRCLEAALAEYRPEVLEQARTLLSADALSRSERFLGVVTWLQERQADRKVRSARLRHNRLWRAVATAPAGFCKPRSSMVGVLLEDLRAGLPFERVKARFDSKMDPLQYQRPQAPPNVGNIRQAEEAFQKLGLAPALARRFATLVEIPVWVWRARTQNSSGVREGVFSHLKPKSRTDLAALQLPTQTLTWVKLRDTVLPQAESIEFLVPGRSHNFCALVTAVNAEAPPLLQWDREGERNPVSWYYYPRGSNAGQWSLTAGWTTVLGVTLKPSMWSGSGFAHQGEAVLFVVEGARDTRNDSVALFPETLRSDLHHVRSTIEAHSRSGKLEDVEGALASGLMFGKGEGKLWADARVRVTTRGRAMVYQLDRWD